ncbi:hypothetical protein DMENIID0001_107790 [Sergentomyia squamirostris]
MDILILETRVRMKNKKKTADVDDGNGEKLGTLCRLQVLKEKEEGITHTDNVHHGRKIHNSTDSVVVLQNVSLSSTGKYRCEVSAEAPSFQTVTDHGDMIVVAEEVFFQHHDIPPPPPPPCSTQ